MTGMYVAGLGALLLTSAVLLCSTVLRPTMGGQRRLMEVHRTTAAPQKKEKKPNFVFFLTDDQDQILGASFPPTAPGGATPMPKTKKLLQDLGAHATNFHIHTPICSPSRSELLTGRYFHNIKRVGPADDGIGMHVNYTKVYDHSFMRRMQESGYKTGLFGKFVNEMPTERPIGFDAWMANGGSDYIAPKFQVKGVSGLPDGNVQFTSAPENYSTSVIGNYSSKWIEEVSNSGPFMAYIAPKAAHEPFIPASWYLDHWDPSWPETEPRTPNWNCSAEARRNHHGNIPDQPMIDEEGATVITGAFKNRWRTLMSVDDLIADVISTVEKMGELENTYFFYTSDHGFQLGQFNILMDKRHVYEWDTKIHLLARGPGISAGSVMEAPATQVDLAPTILGLAGLSTENLDGRSLAPFLVDEEAPASARQHLQALGNIEEYSSKWRKELFFEYYFVDNNTKCAENCDAGWHYPQLDADCVALAENSHCWCESAGAKDCYDTESPANNFIGLRTFEGEGKLYAEFQTGNLAKEAVNFDKIDFVEYFDLASDPWQMNNLAFDNSTATERQAFSQRVHFWLSCKDESCP